MLETVLIPDVVISDLEVLQHGLELPNRRRRPNWYSWAVVAYASANRRSKEPIAAFV